MTLVVRGPGLEEVDPLLPERRLAHADEALEGVDGELGGEAREGKLSWEGSAFFPRLVCVCLLVRLYVYLYMYLL